ncbi:hypothetical protein BCR44DRAFT_1514250 [Catenaria anguillulae PL171]|uniref:Uncharacterized protein n=1 Tax=Catenaria anguillulae PL171 TaxID=765915 RepID=A0A1Y2HHJ1_9FUNG|nr:hypothetical protein BCR44DRAFT_1514250 [Catenaria anguillulae PL171]
MSSLPVCSANRPIPKPTSASAAYMCCLLDNMPTKPDPITHARAYLALGQAQLSEGNAKEAEASLRRAYSLQPDPTAKRNQMSTTTSGSSDDDTAHVAERKQWAAILTTLVEATEAQGKGNQAHIFREKLLRLRELDG